MVNNKEVNKLENKKIEKPKKSKNPKNYVILLLIIIITVGLTVYFCKWYKVYDELQKRTPVIQGTIYSEIVADDLEHYIIENPSCVIYMCMASDNNCRQFEQQFKKYINKKELNDEMVYLNLSGADLKQFVYKFNLNYKSKKELTSYLPAIVIFDNGKVQTILQGKDNDKITITKAKQFIENNKIGD